MVLRGRAVLPGAVLPDAVIVIEGDRFGWIGKAVDTGPATRAAARDGGTMLPGLIDLHCHGGGGHSFPDGDMAGARAAAMHHLRHGTTSLLASLVTAPLPQLQHAVHALTGLVEAGTIVGIHLEGPFLAAARCGAQDPGVMLAPDPAIAGALLAAGGIRTLTLAPELPGAAALAAQVAAAGAVPSVGHTDADAAVTRKALAAISEQQGAPALVTHLFNGMRPWHHRDPGPAAACLASAGRGETVLELIADGVHLADETVRMVFDLVGPERVALVTDAVAAAGTAGGRYRLGRAEIEARDGAARLVADGSLAGGTTRLLDVLRRCVQHAGLPLAHAVHAASLTPARVLGLDGERGALRSGQRADLLCVDDGLHPLGVLRGGRWVPR
jgi:N-acetylglucosamine-6-phosphate deacetylase